MKMKMKGTETDEIKTTNGVLGLLSGWNVFFFK